MTESNKSIAWIEWVDAVGSTGWTDDTVAPTKNISVGLVVYEDDEYIELATTLDTEHGNWNGTMSVPKNMITKRDTVYMGWGENAR